MQQDPSLDRSALTGILLIALIMGAWLVLFQPPAPPPPAEPVAAEQAPEEPTGAELRAERPGSVPPADSAFAAAATGEERLITVQTDLYRAVFSTRGGTLRSFQLTDYFVAGTDTPVELISDPEGALALAFTPPQGRYVDTRSLFFQTLFDGETLDATEQARELVFEVPLAGGVIRYVYTFEPDTYFFNFRIEEEGSDILTASGGYEVIWDGAIPFAEANAREEAGSTGVFARSGGELERLSLSRRPEQSLRLSGGIEWVAIKNKYFLSVMVPQGATEGAELEGRRFGEPGDPTFAEDYALRLLMPRPRGEPVEFTLYAGPIDLQRLGRTAPGIFQVVDYGFGAFMTRPIAEYVVGPLFRFFGRFLPNYGLVIILFALFVKIALYPLTKASYKNTARMRELQPKMEAIKEKYGDDPQKQQEAMLRMYKETGINPLAGCLPLLLQYPIIIALWQYFQNSIVIRQESFLWAHDLSAPDPILHLPFAIPLYGDFVAGFTLIMGLAMVVQMKVAMPPTSGGMQAKIFMYVLPLVLFVVFNRLASGLSLYYLVFNVATIVQQKMINNQMEALGVGEAQPDAKKIKPAGRSGRNGQDRKRAAGPKPIRKRN